MFFLDDKHKKNFWLLMNEYDLALNEDVAYQSSLYIAALPDIFKIFEENIVPEGGGTPLVHFLKWNEEEEHHVIAHARLTGGTKRLVAFGLSLYNGFPCDLSALADVVDEEYQEVILQAYQIRAKLT